MASDSKRSSRVGGVPSARKGGTSTGTLSSSQERIRKNPDATYIWLSVGQRQPCFLRIGLLVTRVPDSRRPPGATNEAKQLSQKNNKSEKKSPSKDSSAQDNASPTAKGNSKDSPKAQWRASVSFCTDKKEPHLPCKDDYELALFPVKLESASCRNMGRALFSYGGPPKGYKTNPKGYPCLAKPCEDLDNEIAHFMTLKLPSPVTPQGGYLFIELLEDNPSLSSVMILSGGLPLQDSALIWNRECEQDDNYDVVWWSLSHVNGPLPSIITVIFPLKLPETAHSFTPLPSRIRRVGLIQLIAKPLSTPLDGREGGVPLDGIPETVAEDGGRAMSNDDVYITSTLSRLKIEMEHFSPESPTNISSPIPSLSPKTPTIPAEYPNANVTGIPGHPTKTSGYNPLEKEGMSTHPEDGILSDAQAEDLLSSDSLKPDPASPTTTNSLLPRSRTMPSRESSRAFTVRPSQKEALREAKTAANQDQETNKDMCKRVRFRVQLAASTPKLRRLLLEDLAKALGVETTRLRVEEIRSAKGNSRRRAALKFPDTERKREASRGSLLAAGFKTKCIITSCISGCYVHRAKREGEDRNTAIRVYIKPVKTPNLEAKLQKECEILLGHSRRCPPHPCIIRLISRMDLRGTTFMITPLMSTRSLQDRLEETDIMGEDVCVCVTVQMALALTHLHSHGVAHGELVPRHILFETEDNFSRAKLTGLGTCELFEAQTETRHSRDGYDADVVSEGTRNLKKADVYALGGLSYRILTGKMPSVKKHGPVNAAIYWGLRMPVSSSAKHAVGNMLESVPGFRRSAPEVLESPWLKSASPAIKALVTMAIDVRDRGIVTGDEWALMKPHLPESCIKSIEKELKAKGELPLATCLKSAVLSREKPKDDTDSNARKYASDSSFLASISASKATGDVAH